MPRSNLSVISKPEVGLVLMDLSFSVIACDVGASAILNSANRPRGELLLPKELMGQIRNRGPADSTSPLARLRIGSAEYICRAYLIESNGGRLNESIVALHLEKDLSASEAASEMRARYHLTERELEALQGILMGLSNKEVAERMNISPNTVKAFLHLIMIKMGVGTRAGIVAKVLHNRAAFEKNGGVSGITSQRTDMQEAASNAVAAVSGAQNTSSGLRRDGNCEAQIVDGPGRIDS